MSLIGGKYSGRFVLIGALLARPSEYINSSREVSYLLGESDCVREICNPGSLTMADRSSLWDLNPVFVISKDR